MKPYSKEHKDNISKAVEKQWAEMSQERKTERILPMMEASQTLIVRRKSAKSCSENYVNSTWQNKLKRSNINRKSTQGRWDKMTKEQRFKYMLPTIKAAQKRWDKTNKKQRLERMLPGISASQKANPSSIERMIWKELDKLKVEYQTQVCFGRFIVDIYVPVWRLIIECNGAYYHNYKKFPEKEIRDKALEEYINKIGFKLRWLWEFDIRENPKQALFNCLKSIGI